MIPARGNVLPFPARRRPGDGRCTFREALARHEVAECEFRLAFARHHLACVLGEHGEGPGTGDHGPGDFWPLFDCYREAALALARTPAPDRRAIERKRKALGGQWLKGEGQFFDNLRSGLDADRRRLGIADK